MNSHPKDINPGKEKENSKKDQKDSVSETIPNNNAAAPADYAGAAAAAGAASNPPADSKQSNKPPSTAANIAAGAASPDSKDSKSAPLSNYESYFKKPKEQINTAILPCERLLPDRHLIKKIMKINEKLVEEKGGFFDRASQSSDAQIKGQNELVGCLNLMGAQNKHLNALQMAATVALNLSHSQAFCDGNTRTACCVLQMILLQEAHIHLVTNPKKLYKTIHALDNDFTRDPDAAVNRLVSIIKSSNLSAIRPENQTYIDIILDQIVEDFKKAFPKDVKLENSDFKHQQPRDHRTDNETAVLETLVEGNDIHDYERYARKVFGPKSLMEEVMQQNSADMKQDVAAPMDAKAAQPPAAIQPPQDLDMPDLVEEDDKADNEVRPLYTVRK